MKQIYDSYVENAFDGNEFSAVKITLFYKNYRKYFNFNNLEKVLDIGVGRGEMLYCMNKWGFVNYLGVDISKSTINLCKDKKLNCELVEDTAVWLNKHPGEFSLITMLDVLEHVKKDNMISLLESIRGSLKSGGRVIIQVPNLQAPDGQLHRYNDITHEVGFVEHSLEQVLRVAGFQHVEIHGFEELTLNSLWKYLVLFLRKGYWLKVRFFRRLNQNLNPKVLNPVMYAVATK